jgi:hypothetical protein
VQRAQSRSCLVYLLSFYFIFYPEALGKGECKGAEQELSCLSFIFFFYLFLEALRQRAECKGRRKGAVLSIFYLYTFIFILKP